MKTSSAPMTYEVSHGQVQWIRSETSAQNTTNEKLTSYKKPNNLCIYQENQMSSIFSTEQAWNIEKSEIILFRKFIRHPFIVHAFFRELFEVFHKASGGVPQSTPR